MTRTAARRAVVVETYADYAVEAYNLRKVYRTRKGRQPAVDGLDLRVPLGGVHGFLGPNGSGKTTTIRMLLGLVAADSGYIRVFDHEVPLHLDRVIDRVARSSSSPILPELLRPQELALLATAIGCHAAGSTRCLPTSGWPTRAGDKFRTYSLGMKQRLAIAATRSRTPAWDFDEPTNGLDPPVSTNPGDDAQSGRPGQDGADLQPPPGEVQQVADTVSIIGRGRMLAGAGGRTSSPGPGAVRPGSASSRPGGGLRPAAGFVVEQSGGSCSSG